MEIYTKLKKHCIGISVFGYENKENFPIYVSKKCYEEKHVDLLLIGEEGKRRYILIKDSNTFICDHTLHLGRKYFCRYCLQTVSTKEMFKLHFKDYFKINTKQIIIIPNNDEYVKFKNYKRKIKSQFIIYADFESL